jgi:putative ATP-binding cassette transporter
MQLVLDELPKSALISIGHRPGLDAFHERTLHLQRGPEGARLAMRPPTRVLKNRTVKIRNPFRRRARQAPAA